MPQSDRSQSSFHLRSTPSQSVDTRLSVSNDSMSNSDTPTRHASFLRKLGPRRARPSAASVADLFVSSLVIAGHCREHAPRTRGLSTMSWTTPHDAVGRLNGRGVHTTRQLSQARLDCRRATGECLQVHRARAQRMFNSGIAPKVEDDTEGGRAVEGPLGDKVWSERHDAYARSKPTQCVKATSLLEAAPTIDTAGFYNEPEAESTTMDTAVEEDTPGTRPNLLGRREDSRYARRTDAKEELRGSTSQLYKAIFGDSLDWKQAVDRATDDAMAKVKTRPASPSVEELVDALWSGTKSNQYLFRLYRELPQPGVSYLSKKSCGLLLRRFADPGKRRLVDARRYLALIDDMILANLPLSRSLWTSAIHLAGRTSGKVFKEDLVRSIGLWQQMEHVRGIQADNVVFNYVKRGIVFHRAGKVTEIFFYGAVGDVEAIRRCFDEFVASGEIVDTVVMNCLLRAFLKAGDHERAEQLYQSMVAAQRTLILDGDRWIHGKGRLTAEFAQYRKRNKELNRLLQLSGALKDRLPEHHRALQNAFSMVPDTRTFHILLSHHAHHTGDIHAFMSVVQDMEKTFTVPPRGMIYTMLFEGFAINARKRRGWTSARLQQSWEVYLRAIYESKARFYDRVHNRHLVWESPVKDWMATATAGSQVTLPKVPKGLYTPLPTEQDILVETRLSEMTEKPSEPAEDDSPSLSEAGDPPDAERADHLDHEEMFDPHAHNLQDDQDLLDGLEHRIENGVFLGRRMIVTILRAFGSCCGPREVMDVWLKIEHLWQPQRRKAIDVMKVREELDKQINMGQERY
ncbi:pentatricopeptide repeat protein [Aspergillus campestris IBT 28561]|uniref:Pentatricopeptide repeat protein n=1 Tax=Aspergillus campestris (strain IBT 28561) TaxID=1392248 RepID=A0A2I1CX32_ASPC2|nr:pentatricopeptide repeat protein [Aspergillus campestris IBT 28561]PKY02187.1 pentatricopeptide repeat protein [Aspergillus campestris IBT 28561]